MKELSNNSLSFIKALSKKNIAALSNWAMNMSHQSDSPKQIATFFWFFSGKLRPDVLELLRDGPASTSLKMLSCVTILVFEEGLKVSKGRFDLCHCRLLRGFITQKFLVLQCQQVFWLRHQTQGNLKGKHAKFEIQGFHNQKPLSTPSFVWMDNWKSTKWYKYVQVIPPNTPHEDVHFDACWINW